MRHFNIVVMISGNGSNLQALIDAIEQQQCPARIAAVISDNPEAYGLARAIQRGINTHIVAKKPDMTRETYDHTLIEVIENYQPHLICLAGFMRILGPEFIASFKQRIVNIHPSLLPAYPGLNTHQRVLDAGERYHGTTLHWVTEQLDAGPIIEQSQLEILPDETEQSLKQRVQALEHVLYPKVVTQFALDFLNT